MSNINEQLNQFHDIANSPRKQMDRYLSEGKKIIGWMPVYAPTELVNALGMIPFGCWGADMQINEAKKYYPAFYCGIAQTVLELGISGAYKGMSAIMIPALCDTLKCQGQNWRFAVPDITMIPVIHPQNRKPQYGKTFMVAKYRKIAEELEKIAGISLTDGALAIANEMTNRHNAAMRAFSDLAVDFPNTINAIARRDVFKSAYFTEIGSHTEMVEKLNETLKQTVKEQSNKKKVILTGIIADNESLLTIFDDRNLQIVGDDLANESRQYRTDIPKTADPMDALAQQFCDRDNCSVLYDATKHRVDFLLEMANAEKADGLIVVMTKFCDPEEFDYVPIKKGFEAAEIPVLQIETDRQMAQFEQIKTAVQTFAEMLQ